jgi:hypothetical protein
MVGEHVTLSKNLALNIRHSAHLVTDLEERRVRLILPEQRQDLPCELGWTVVV